MKWLASSKDEQNRAVLDPWTIVHFGTGLAAGLTDAPPVPALTAAIAYEGAEQVMERKELWRELFKTSGPESRANAVMDILVFALGMWLGRLWNASRGDRDAPSRRGAHVSQES